MGANHRVVIIMGSRVDLEWAGRISEELGKFGIESEKRIASAHKTPMKCIEIVKNSEGNRTVFITVAGRSNALSGFVDAQTQCPVIACPPSSEKFAGADILSTLRMPSGVAPMAVTEPENAALAAAKIIGCWDGEVLGKVRALQEKMKNDIAVQDKEAADGKR